MADRYIYLDNAATTPCDKRVVNKMLPYFSEIYGNPSGIYKVSRQAKKGMDEARKIIAKFLNCQAGEIIFTNGGTESDNIAIFGVANSYVKSQITNRKSQINSKSEILNSKFCIQNSKPHIVTTQIEHPAVLNSCRQLEKEGFEVTYLPVDKEGLVSAQAVREAIRPETVLVSIMYANNEIGTIQPIAEIADVIKNFRSSKLKAQSSNKAQKTNDKNSKVLDFGLCNLDLAAKYPLLHSDACQATQYLEMDVAKLGVDLLTFNGSKIYGPKGIGALYVKSGVVLSPILFGGEQEREIRPGTENVPAIVGLGEAVKLIDPKEGEREKKLRDYLTQALLKIGGTELNGSASRRLPNNINIAFKGIEGESMVLYLDREGICVSTGSACLSQSLEPSHVIVALGKGKEAAHGSLRFTLGRFTTKSELAKTIKMVKAAVQKLREISAIDKK